MRWPRIWPLSWNDERGSALVESAILFPVLILLWMFGAALTDAMILKLKAAEAVRYALWETTVFKQPQQIADDVSARFRDLKSPRDLDTKGTDLLLAPLASDLRFQASVDTTSTKAGIGGERAQLPGGFWSEALGRVSDGLGSSVDAIAKAQGFNLFGAATATVSLARASDASPSRLLAGGDFVGLRDGRSLSMPDALEKLAFQAPLPGERPMQIVFDTWKAWPKPAAATFTPAPTAVGTSPMNTYPVVEEMVSAQVRRIAFAGLGSAPWFKRLDDVANKVLGSGVSEAVLGGRLPSIFSAERMDGPLGGTISILPVGLPDVPWAPSQCDVNGASRTCGTHRLGALVSSTGEPQFLGDDDAMGSRVDRTRYTVPFRINSAYWTKDGGVNDPQAAGASLQVLPPSMATDNESVRSWNCRGHFFAGAQTAQETDRARRYSGREGSCP
jgi:hypothetical protein